MAFRGLLILPLLMFAAACTKSELAVPVTGPNQVAEPIVVPFPPPAARPEIIPAKPGELVVWVDGSWTWDRRRWVWQPGRWEVPPTGQYYAQSRIVRLSDGTVGYYPGGWQKPAPKKAPSP